MCSQTGEYERSCCVKILLLLFVTFSSLCDNQAHGGGLGYDKRGFTWWLHHGHPFCIDTHTFII